jgi:uncharacterized protein YydD (DUF2326 family)
MIYSVSANQRSFHTVTFTTGLNVILAERSETSTEKDTRNGLGKSTLIEIIDFCLGLGFRLMKHTIPRKAASRGSLQRS